MTFSDSAHPLRRNRKTKIVATIGPASDTLEIIEQLFLQGVDVFRLNFSHGTHADHARRLGYIRAIEAKHKHPIAIMADMQGPKLRVGKFTNGSIDIKAGHIIRLDLDPTPGDETRVNLPHPEVIDALDKGAMILVDDGKVRLRIIDKGKDFMMAEVVNGRKLSNNKGFNVPGTILPIPALTAKDRIDLEAAIDMGVDWIAQSFVQRPEDVDEARSLIRGRAALLIKIEKPSALECLEALIARADGVMLARGDLGVEIPPEDVPSTQKRVVRMVRRTGKPLIIATQMLESMIENPAPTRAEASDVATAVYDGTDAVMLSGETASGSYPLEAVTIMDKICTRVEQDDFYHDLMDADYTDGSDAHDALTRAAYQVARDLNAACVVCYTQSGTTALRMARHRPWTHIMSLTPVEKVARRLVMSYAMHPVVVPQVATFADAVKTTTQVALQQEMAKPGQRLVMTAGVPFGQSGTTNILRVIEVE
jgi:pyruvate kinase